MEADVPACSGTQLAALRQTGQEHGLVGVPWEGHDQLADVLFVDGLGHAPLQPDAAARAQLAVADTRATHPTKPAPVAGLATATSRIPRAGAFGSQVAHFQQGLRRLGQ